MKLGSKNLAILGLMLLAFGIPSVRLAFGNRELKERLELENSRASEGRHEESEQHSRRDREMTVGQLFRGTFAAGDARSLLRAYTLATQSRNQLAYWKLKLDLGQLALDELQLLRAELQTLSGVWKERVELMITEAEMALAPEDLGRYFDGVIEVGVIDRELQKLLEGWASSDPETALAWFQKKSEANGFQNASFESNENRALVLASLLGGIAVNDLDLAVALFSKETRQAERLKGAAPLIPLAMKRAIEQGDESLFRTVLETALIEGNPFWGGGGNPWYEYTSATGDLKKSMELLRSMNNQSNVESKMGHIISAQIDMPLNEKLDWLQQQDLDENEQINGMEVPLRIHLSDGSDERFQETLAEVLAQGPGRTRDLEVLALMKVFYSGGKESDARLITDEISDPDLRAKAINHLDSDPFRASVEQDD